MVNGEWHFARFRLRLTSELWPWALVSILQLHSHIHSYRDAAFKFLKLFGLESKCSSLAHEAAIPGLKATALSLVYFQHCVVMSEHSLLNYRSGRRGLGPWKESKALLPGMVA